MPRSRTRRLLLWTTLAWLILIPWVVASSRSMAWGDGRDDTPSTTPMVSHCLQLAGALGIEPDQIAFSILLPNGARLDHRHGEPMIPASNMKLLVAVAALDGLGPGFLIRTDLWRRGALRQGVLHGDLVVIGRGDPSFSARYFPNDVWAPFRPWLGQLKELGIERIEGEVVADSRYFSGPSRASGWPEQQHHKWYSAPSGTLNFNDNCVDVHIRPSAQRNAIEVYLVPASGRFEVSSSIRPVAATQDHLYSVNRAPGSWSIELRGGFLRSGEERVEWISVPDPEVAFLEAFRGLLSQEGIVVVGRPQQGVESPSLLVARRGTSVIELLPVLLKRSQNLYGDCLLRILGKERQGQGSFVAGGEWLKKFVSQRLRIEGPLHVADGSGLSSENQVSSTLLLELLRFSATQEWGDQLFESLAIAGRDGTLARRFRQSRCRDRVWGKTGSLSGVSTLSGVMDGASGRTFFALMFDGPAARSGKARKWQQQVLEYLFEGG